MTVPDTSTILIVEDTESNVDILVNTLGDMYDVSVAMDGESALELLKREKPDLILLDILMPGMNGYQVCRAIKADPCTREIPVIFVTIQQDVANETKGFNEGAVDYITKPFSPPVVRARVKTHLALKKARETLKAQNEELIKTALLREEVERMTKHDLKNPLQAIMGISELVARDQDTPSGIVSFMEKIQDASLRMLQMINSSMDLFKMEQGTYTISTQRVDLMRILRRISAESLRTNRTSRNRISIVDQSPAPAPDSAFWVMGEELLLYSMLDNLISNALEAAPPEEDVTITLGGNGMAMVSVRNKGEVPPEIRDNFFDKYVTCGKVKGTGLGTYTAKLIAQTHGGEISLDASHPGETTVTVSLRPAG